MSRILNFADGFTTNTAPVSSSVSGPVSATDNAIARFDTTTGKLLQNSVITLSDTGIIAGSSIDADTNTITNIKNADVKTGAAIALNKLAATTASKNLVSDASGFITSGNASSVESDYVVGGLSGQLTNIGLSSTVAVNAMTIALKTAAGNNASSTDPISVAFRSATPGSGAVSIARVTGALSTVISSGSTAGQTSGVAAYIYVYLINNAGTVELAWSRNLYDDGSVITTTAEGGAGAADSSSIIYSTTARSNVASRLIGRLLNTQATSGIWTSAPAEQSIYPFKTDKVVAIYSNGTGHNITNATDTFLDYATLVIDNRNIVQGAGSGVVTTTNTGWRAIVPNTATYRIDASVIFASTPNWAAGESCRIDVFVNGSVMAMINRKDNFTTTGSPLMYLGGSKLVTLNAGDRIEIGVNQQSGGTLALNGISTINRVSIEEL